MRLKSVRIENFKSIHDSGTFAIDQVTCLVGKNESGKTAILQSLEKLEPIIEEDRGTFKELEEFPRMTYYDYTDGNRPKNVVTSIWELTDAEETSINELVGCNILQSREVVLKKGYANTLEWTVRIDYAAAVKHLVSNAGLYKEEEAELKDIANTSDLIKKVNSYTEPSERQAQFQALLKKKFADGSLITAVTKYLKSQLPYFLYFGNYESMQGRVPIEVLANKEANNQLTMPDRVFLALLRMAGTSIKDLKNLQQFESLRANLEAISNKLSKEIFKYWSQNRNLKLEFDYRQALPKDPPPFDSGNIFHTRVRNTRHDVSVPFDDRSTGFVWFFSFLVWFSQVKNEYQGDLILLLDEPGLNLHAKAQADLLRYINEKLAPEHQVIYSTHSPFMVDANALLSVRTVEDVVKDEEALGTKVSEDVLLTTDKDTLFPLQAALGYDITQSLFIGEHCLLVEGPGDVMTIQWASEELKRAKRNHLDSRWVVTPTGGIDKISTFVSLFSGNNIHAAALTDYAQGDKSKLHRLKEAKLLREGHIFTAADLTGQDEADIEDMLGRELYITLINECYGLSKKNQLSADRPDNAPIRVVKEVEDHFRVLPNTVPEFDHFTPAAYLLRHADDLRDKLSGHDAALDRFEELFKALNKLL